MCHSGKNACRRQQSGRPGRRGRSPASPDPRRIPGFAGRFEGRSRSNRHGSGVTASRNRLLANVAPILGTRVPGAHCPALRRIPGATSWMAVRNRAPALFTGSYSRACCGSGRIRITGLARPRKAWLCPERSFSRSAASGDAQGRPFGHGCSRPVRAGSRPGVRQLAASARSMRSLRSGQAVQGRDLR